MTADERIALIRIKIERAKKHISDLQVAIRTFSESHPYELGAKRNPQTGQLVYYLADFRDVPLDISAIAGDVLQNLRSALDHLAFQLFSVGPGGQRGETGKHIYFPIFDDVAKYKSGVEGKVQGIAPEAISAIHEVKPYKGGNDLLWCLSKLNNIDKHRLLIPAIVEYCATSFRLDDSIPLRTLIDFRRVFKNYPGGNFAGISKPLKIGDELFISAPNSKLNQEMQFHFHVALNEPEIGESQPLIETLQHMVDLVDNIVACFRPLLA